MSIAEIITGYQPWQNETYRWFHRHPELSTQEFATAERIEAELDALGLSHTRIGGTGVVTVLKNGAGASVLARADTDALPVTEDTGLEYVSETPGIMHACGHDSHITALLGAVRYFHENRSAWKGNYVAIFQPAEEGGIGAQKMVDDGLVDRLAAQGVERIDVGLGQHVIPGAPGDVMVCSGVALSSELELEITIFGKGGHGSMPHTTVDPVLLASAIVMRLQGIVAREIMPGEFAVVTVGQIHAGTRPNIIADQATLGLSVRGLKNETINRIHTAIERIVRAECAASGSPQEPEIKVIGLLPVTHNDETQRKRVFAAFEKEFGADGVHHREYLTASEDFSVLPDAFGAPYVYWFVGGTPEELADNPPSNHSPFFAPPAEQVLPVMTRAHIAAGLEYLA